MSKRNSGFTLIELLVVIGILAVLLAIVLVAINPARQFAQANNTKRASDINALLNAVHQYAADNKGNITALGITDTATVINSTNGFAGLCNALVTEYIAALPVDPLTNNGIPVQEATCGGTWDTNYTIYRSVADNRITVVATATEAPITTPLSVMR